jgi:[ribosomal protein S18]-alanine N-acetyltransferase
MMGVVRYRRPNKWGMASKKQAMVTERNPTMSVTVRAPERVRVHIRWMIRRDLADVMRIELAGFEYAWTEEDFLRCLRQRNCIGMVAEQGDRIVGFMIYELHKNKLNVLNFAVASHVRRQGIGMQMVAKLVAKLASHRRSKISLAIRERNLHAQLFFRSLMFRATKVLKNYYSDSGEDAYLMEYNIPETDANVDTQLVNRVAEFEHN